MSDSPTSEPKSSFVCDCKEWVRSACSGEHFYGEHEGRRYCVLHFPAEKDNTKFLEALKRRRDLDFRGVWFTCGPRFETSTLEALADFSDATFSVDVNFSGFTFNSEVRFFKTTFAGKANFRSATFGEPAYLSAFI